MSISSAVSKTPHNRPVYTNARRHMMFKRSSLRIPVCPILAAAGAAAWLFTMRAAAPWLSYPSHGIPRTPDGKANLSAPAPKTADGKPDISGPLATPA
jgi:hypothetical protein